MTRRLHYNEAKRITTCNVNGRMNIGGGKAYNRNEFRDVHDYQSANTSRPPSVHVDDFGDGPN